MNDTNQEIAAELEDVAMQLAGRGLLADELDLTASQAFSTDISHEFQRLQLATDMLDYQGLSPVIDWLIKNTEQVAQAPQALKTLQNDGHFFQWAELLAATLRQQDGQLIPDLTQCLTDTAWPIAMPQEVVQSFVASLPSSPSETQATSPVEAPTPAPVAAAQNAYTIRWDSGVHPEILEAFLADTPDQITEATALIHKIARGDASNDEHQLAARLTHTIKGASGVVGVTSLLAFTHPLEDLLEFSVDHALDADTQELLSASADCLDGMGESMLNQRPLPEQFEPLLKRLEAKAKQLQHSSPDEQADSEETLFEFDAPATPREPAGTSPLASTAGQSGLSTELLASQLLLETPVEGQTRTRQFGANETTMRVPISLIDDLLNLAEELVTSTSQVNDKVKFILQQSQELRKQDDQLAANMDELEQSIDTQFQHVRQQNDQNPEFDQLELEVYNELHSVHGLLSETIADNREIERSIQENLRELSNQLHSQQRINRELNATIIDTRMESLDTLTPRLERIVRETCRSTGKQAEFTVTGNNLAVDTDILKGLTDPLLHLLRNAVDHGIETKAERLAKGKPESGSIKLSFKQEGRYVLMSLQDDGAGIDTESVYQRALSQGMIKTDKILTETEKLQLILLPGFSTRDAVSDISGRGVGMDVVNDAVSKLRGTLELDTSADKGTQISIRLPLTLVAANTLMVQAAGKTVAIPVDSVDKLHTLSSNSITQNDGQLTTQISDKTYQLRRLSQLLNWGNPPLDPAETYNVILLDHKQQSYALVIDAVLQPREVVVKSLAPWLSNIPGVNGACLLSDGAVAAVLDIPRLMQHEASDARSETTVSSIEPDEAKQLILVVDDSLSNRKSLSITAEQLGYQTISASDGDEALKLMEEQMPQVLLTDLEMPRMNGLELSKAVRAWPEAQDIPIVMITSRATSKHRKQAQLAGVNSYIVKPVDRDTLQNQLKKWLN